MSYRVENTDTWLNVSQKEVSRDRLGPQKGLRHPYDENDCTQHFCALESAKCNVNTKGLYVIPMGIWVRKMHNRHHAVSLRERVAKHYNVEVCELLTARFTPHFSVCVNKSVQHCRSKPVEKRVGVEGLVSRLCVFLKSISGLISPQRNPSQAS